MDFSIRFGHKVSTCEHIIGYTFESKELCAEALNAAGDYSAVYTLDGHMRKMAKNDILAVYGDSVADFYLCGLWRKPGRRSSEFPPCALSTYMPIMLTTTSSNRKALIKAHWTTMRGDLLGNKNLERVGRNHGLGECLILNPGTHFVSAKMMATAVEAILGAVHEDGGDKALAEVMDRLHLAEHPLLSSVTSLVPNM